MLAQDYAYYAQQFGHLYALENHPIGMEVARAYTVGDMQGWDENIAREAFNVVGQGRNVFGSPVIKPLNLDGRLYRGKKTLLYDFCRKVLGKDTPNYPQEIGDCVSFGGKNATEYVSCTEVLMADKPQKWRPVFPPYYYHTSRIKVGRGAIPAYEDGSSGAWLAEAVALWGTLVADEPGVPPYSGRLAKQWGGIEDIGSQFYDFGKKHVIHSAALIRSWDDLVAAIANGYPCTTASNVGYNMEANSDGFHRRGPAWGHQMCFIAVGFVPEEYAIILNNWGDVHGRLKDFDDSSDLPKGVLRVRRRDAEAHIQANETYAWSQYDGFPEQVDRLEKALFKVVGN